MGRQHNGIRLLSTEEEHEIEKWKALQVQTSCTALIVVAAEYRLVSVLPSQRQRTFHTFGAFLAREIDQSCTHIVTGSMVK